MNWLQVVPTTVRQFTVIWAATATDANDTTTIPAIRARAVAISAALPVPADADGAIEGRIAVDLASNVYDIAVAAGERGDGGVLLAWIESAAGERRVHLTSYDAALRVTADVLVSTAAMTSVSMATPPVPDEIGIDVASDGYQALVAWIEHDTTPAQRPRVWGRYLEPATLRA